MTSHQRRWWWLWLAAAILLLGWFEGRLRPAWQNRSLPAGSAEWIWREVQPEEEWVGFFALRDFWVEEALDSPARLIVAADEEYILFLNGHAVGSGSQGPGDPLDSYDVSSIVRQGENRILVELRSSRGIGGFLASLEVGDTPLIVSNGSWRVIEEYREDFKWPGKPVGETMPVRVWGRSPTGRWGSRGGVAARPRLPQQLLSRKSLPAELMRTKADRGKWRQAPAEPSREEPLGSWVTFDFGRQVNGYLNIVTARRGGARGLFWASTSEPPEPATETPTGRMLLMVGQGSWTDAVPRSFRYLTVVSLAEIAGARAFVLEPELEPALLRLKSGRAGVLGLEPPTLRAPVEDEFWREFERQASVADREDL